MLELRTLLLCEELLGGGHRVAPVAGPGWVSHGDSLQACLAEQRRFLEHHLASALPEEVARYSLPEGTSLREVVVPVQLPGAAAVPRGLRTAAPLRLAAVVIPEKPRPDGGAPASPRSAAWVFVPALELTTRLEGEEDLDERIAAEAVRLISARELTAAEHLPLLARGRMHLEPLDLRPGREPAEGEGSARELRRALQATARRKEALAILRAVAQPVHERAEATNGPALIGRDDEVQALGALLSGPERVAVLLVGPELCGKSALLYGWLRAERAAGRAPQVWATSGSELIAGMSGLGQWQERLERVMKAAEELGAVLYFEDLGELLSANSGDFIDLPGALKRWLDEGRVRLLGELASGSLELLERRHPGLLSTLSRLQVRPLDAAQTRAALQARITFLAEREPERPNLAPEAVQPLLDLTERYLPYRAQPGKAMRLLDELRATAAAGQGGGEPKPIDAAAVRAGFSARTGVPDWLLREDRPLFAEQVRAQFEAQLAGQRTAIARVAETLCVVKASLQPQGKPLSTLLFVGPTGVGKTELARLLATFLFGSAERLFRFDMSEYMDPYAAERLLRGSDGGGGALTRKVRQQPFCVVLLDEIEKAHPAVFDLLLQIAGEGRLTDGLGRTAWFHNCILLLTSNLGAAHRRAPIGAAQQAGQDAEYYKKAVERAFRPELVNRLDQIIAFDALGEAETLQVARLVIDKVRTRRGLRELGAGLEVSPEALAALAREGHDPALGGRAMRRHVEQALVAPLARALAGAGRELYGATALVEPGGVTLAAPLQRARRAELSAVQAASKRRRFFDRLLALEPVRNVQDRLAYLTAELAQQDRPAKGYGAAGFGEMQEEHHRLAALRDEAARLREECVALEEVALEALLTGAEAPPIALEGAALEERFRKNLVYLLLCTQDRRDEIALLAQEVDEEGAFDAWLLGLLENAKERGWTALVHLDGDDPPPGRRWGPSRSAAVVLEQLRDPKREWRSALVRVRGPYAGALLAFEQGLYRCPSQGGAALLLVQVLSQRFELTDAQLALSAAAPDRPPSAAQLSATRAHRDLTAPPQPGWPGAPLTKANYWARFEDLVLQDLLDALGLGDGPGGALPSGRGKLDPKP